MPLAADNSIDTLFGLIGALSTIILGLIVVIFRMSQQMARIQEWIRVYERKNGKNGV